MLEAWHKMLDESGGTSTRDEAVRLFGPECAVEVCMHVCACVYVCMHSGTR